MIVLGIIEPIQKRTQGEQRGGFLLTVQALRAGVNKICVGVSTQGWRSLHFDMLGGAERNILGLCEFVFD